MVLSNTFSLTRPDLSHYLLLSLLLKIVLQELYIESLGIQDDKVYSTAQHLLLSSLYLTKITYY